jgi:hypothetical protein
VHWKRFKEQCMMQVRLESDCSVCRCRQCLNLLFSTGSCLDGSLDVNREKTMFDLIEYANQVNVLYLCCCCC